MIDSAVIDAPKVHRALTSYYAWMSLGACLVIAAVLLSGADLRIASGLASGALAGLTMVASWHWLLARKRSVITYILVFPVKYVVLFGGLYFLCTRGFADPLAVAGGGVLPVLCAFPLAAQAMKESR